MMKVKKMLFCAVVASAVAAMGSAPSGEEQAKRQARSVHLHWAGIPTNAVEVVGSVKVTEEQTNSYFMVIGFDGGYMGIQNFLGQHVGIFSIWDPVGDAFDFGAKEHDVDEKMRASVKFAANNVIVSRFGGEGTGAKTMFGCNWKVGETIRFRITAEPDGADRTLFTGYVGNDSGEEKIAAISRLHHGAPSTVRHVHSFVEDFWRNGLSKALVRRAEFFGFAGRAQGETGLSRAVAAKFTGDSNTLMTIDAGPVKGGGFLQTGGETKNEHVPIYGVFRIEQ